jgi:predicted metalloprotease
MRFGDDDNADSSEVEDRRGMSFPGGAVGAGVGGLGLVGTLVVIAIRLLGGNVVVDDGSGRGGPPTSANGPDNGGPSGPGERPGERGTPNDHVDRSDRGARGTTALSGSCAGVNSANDPAKFIVCVETSVQKFWTTKLAASGRTYEPAKLVLFTDATPSACGTASAQTGPFYCPPDQKVYLDIGFFQELEQRFHARGGDFAEAYVVAHEYGHRVQDVLGIEKRMRQEEHRDPDDANALSVKLELQADCFAGVWGHAEYASGVVSSSEIAQALDAAASVGDDRIQKQMQGRVHPESFTHGSAADRQKWFKAGMDSGDPTRCDTFGEGVLR